MASPSRAPALPTPAQGWDTHVHIFDGSVAAQAGHDNELMRRLSLVDESGERRVRMAYVAVLASHSINGVSALHSELMKQSIFADFARLFPERFNNKTNGVTPRRWLAQANPPLAALLDARIGKGWRRDLSQLEALRPMAAQPAFVRAFRNVYGRTPRQMRKVVDPR